MLIKYYLYTAYFKVKKLFQKNKSKDRYIY